MATIREIKVMGRKGAYELSVLVDEEDYQTLKLSEYGFSRLIGRNTTYVWASKNGKAILLHRLIMGLSDGPSSIYVDHIDYNGLNNSRTNLRTTDSSGNQQHTRKLLSAKKSSSYKGVSWNWTNNHTKPWNAYITLPNPNHHGILKNLGYYRTQEEAATAYNKAAIELFGPMACLNVIGPKDFCLTDLTFPKSAPII